MEKTIKETTRLLPQITNFVIIVGRVKVLSQDEAEVLRKCNIPVIVKGCDEFSLATAMINMADKGMLKNATDNAKPMNSSERTIFFEQLSNSIDKCS